MNSAEKLKKDIEEYINRKGWSGFFGLLATIAPQNIDKEDLKKIEKSSLPVYVPNSSSEELPNQENDIKEASIYAAEHIPAVLEDKNEEKIDSIGESEKVEQGKTRILENKSIPGGIQKNETPNPWQDIQVVSPGQLKL